MNALPSYTILDFFDWVNENNTSSINIGFVRECAFRARHVSGAFNDLKPYAAEFISQKRLKIQPFELTESLRFYLNDISLKNEKEIIEEALYKSDKRERSISIGNGSQYIECMTVTKDIALEIEFLEWFTERRSSKNDVLKMPLHLFIDHAKEYLEQRDGVIYQNRLDDLIKFFKFDNPKTLFDRLINSLPKKDYEKYKSLQYLYDRYTNPSTFKCFFLWLHSGVGNWNVSQHNI